MWSAMAACSRDWMSRRGRVESGAARGSRPGRSYGPRTTDEVSRILAICNAAGQPVVAQGGLTGLVEGHITDEGEIVLSLERMNAIEEVNPLERTMTVQAGVVLQAVHDAAEEHGLMYPLDIGGRGSCTLGGNIATNAGGNRVIRYGMTRDMVLGVEAVLADGTVVSSMNHMIKNNAGYDLKQLFIGTEGSLGIVTRAVLRLREKPRSQETMLVAVCQLRPGHCVAQGHGRGARRYAVRVRGVVEQLLPAGDHATRDPASAAVPGLPVLRPDRGDGWRSPEPTTHASNRSSPRPTSPGLSRTR